MIRSGCEPIIQSHLAAAATKAWPELSTRKQESTLLRGQRDFTARVRKNATE